MAAPARKRRTNVTLDSALLDAAHELGLNVSRFIPAGLPPYRTGWSGGHRRKA